MTQSGTSDTERHSIVSGTALWREPYLYNYILVNGLNPGVSVVRVV